MNLATRNLLACNQAPTPRPTAPLDFEFGWPAVRTGLHSMLLGYLVSVGMGLFAVALALWVVTTILQAQGLGDIVDAAMVLYAGIGILFLMGVLSLSLIIKGQIRCLINAPERCGARWLMFSSALCVVLGPALNITSAFVGSPAKAPPAVASRDKNGEAVAEVRLALREYGASLMARDGRAYVSLAGDVGSLLSGVFFVLFLRAVARCFDDTVRVRIAELYLLLTGVLFAVTLYLFLNPLEFLNHPQWILGLVGGWFVAGWWYFLLLISTSSCIAEGLARRRPPLEMPPESEDDFAGFGGKYLDHLSLPGDRG
jgi:hypothetical protein